MTLNRRRLIQTGSLAAAGVLAPPAWSQPARPLTFLVTGDWGQNGETHQKEVGVRMGETAARVNSQFVATVGDNFYSNGVQSTTDPLWKARYEDVYAAPSLMTPWYASLGNHDYGGVVQAQIDYGAVSSRWRMPARYYVQSVSAPDGARADLFFIDTTALCNGYRGDGNDNAQQRENARSQDADVQLAWLESVLARSTAPWKIAFGHHPIYSGGDHGDTREIIAMVRPIFMRHGVQAYIFGHDHDLQHIERDGMLHVGTGAGATTREVKAVEGTRFCSDKPGFTAYRLSTDRLAIDYIDHTGALLHTAEWARAHA